MASDTDSFVIASLAVWAEDYQYAYERLTVDSWKTPVPKSMLEHPELFGAWIPMFVRTNEVTQEAYRQRLLRENQTDAQVSLPFLIYTRELRGTIRREGPFGFRLRAYPLSLDPEGPIYRLLLTQNEAAQSKCEEDESQPYLGFDFGTIPTELVISEIGQIEAFTLYRSTPSEGMPEEVVENFVRLLERIETLKR